MRRHPDTGAPADPGRYRVDGGLTAAILIAGAVAAAASAGVTVAAASQAADASEEAGKYNAALAEQQAAQARDGVTWHEPDVRQAGAFARDLGMAPGEFQFWAVEIARAKPLTDEETEAQRARVRSDLKQRWGDRWEAKVDAINAMLRSRAPGLYRALAESGVGNRLDFIVKAAEMHDGLEQRDRYRDSPKKYGRRPV